MEGNTTNENYDSDGEFRNDGKIGDNSQWGLVDIVGLNGLMEWRGNHRFDAACGDCAERDPIR